MSLNISQITKILNTQQADATANIGSSTKESGKEILTAGVISKPKWYQFGAMSQFKEANRETADKICLAIKTEYGDAAEGIAKKHLAKTLKKGEAFNFRQLRNLVDDVETSTQNRIDKSLMSSIKALAGSTHLTKLNSMMAGRSSIITMMSAQELLENMVFKQPELTEYKNSLETYERMLKNTWITGTNAEATALRNDVDTYLTALSGRIALVNMQIGTYPTNVEHLREALQQKYLAATDVIKNLEIKFMDDPAKLQALSEIKHKLIDKMDNVLAGKTGLASKEDSKQFLEIHSALTKEIVSECKKNNIPVKEKEIAAQFKAAFIAVRNSDKQNWGTITKQISTVYKGELYDLTSKIDPVKNFGVTSSSLFGGKGVTSMDVASTHTVNLAHTSSNVGNVEVFSGFRHGVHSAFGIKNADGRIAANTQRVDEMYIAMLEKKGLLGNPSSATAPIILDITSISLLTPEGIRSGANDEKRFLLEQNNAWRSGQTISINIPAVGDQPDRTIFVKPQVLTFNFGVNAGGQGFKSAFVGGWGTSNTQNQVAMTALLTKTDAAINSQNTSPQLREQLTQLKNQIETLWASGEYKAGGENPYRLPSRIAMLTYLLDETPAFNCKSGKDRTGQMDVETKLLATQMHITGQVPSIVRSTDPEDQQLFDIIAINSGNHEMQTYNTGLAGFKTKGVDGLNKSFSPGVKEVQYGQAGVVKA